MNEYLCIDIGGTNIKYGIMNNIGKLKWKKTTSTPNSGLEEFLEKINEIISQHHEEIVGVAFSTPGKVDKQTKTIYFGGALQFLHGLNLVNHVKQKYPNLIVSVENDGKAAALSESWLGDFQDTKEGITLVLGTGLGGGIVLDGKIWRGINQEAGELSLLLNNFEKIEAKSFSAYSCSAVVMITTIAKILEFDDIYDGKSVFEEIKKENPKVMPIFQEFCKNVAYVIHNLQVILDLKKVVVGGGISAQPILIKRIEEEYKLLRSKIPGVEHMFPECSIKKSKFANDSNLYGALYNLLEEFDNKK